MNIASKFDIAALNLFVAASEGTVSTEHRMEIFESVAGDLDLMVEALNALIVGHNARVYSGTLSAEKAFKSIKAEYKAIGFGEIVPFDCMEGPLEMLYYRKSSDEIDMDHMFEIIQKMFQKNETCPNERIKCGVYQLALRTITHYNLVAKDISFSRQVIDKVNSYTQEQKDSALLPPAIVTEL